MLFSSTYNHKTKNSILPSDDGGWNDLANWLGISTDDLEVTGTRSLKEITVYTCIKILSETLGKLPLKIVQNQDGSIIPTKHYLDWFVNVRPNEYMTPSDFWKCLEVQRNIYGNSYAWMDIAAAGRNAGQIQGLYPLDSTRVIIYVDDVGLISNKQSVWYVFTDLMGNQYKLREGEILHFKGLSSNGLSGLSTIETLKSAIENAKAAGNFLNNSYKNGMQSAGIINYVGDLSPEAEKTFRDKFEQMSSGLKNANRISLLPIGYQYQPMALKLTDAQFLENTRLTLQQLTAAFGIKPHQVNDQAKTSYASTAESNREFYTDTLMAILNAYEQELRYKLFLNSEILKGYYIQFDTNKLLSADPKTRAEIRQLDIQSGHKTINETRADEGLVAKEGGEQLLVNGTMVPAKDAGAAYKKGGNQ